MIFALDFSSPTPSSHALSPSLSLSLSPPLPRVEIAAVHKDGTYDVAFNDGFKEPKVPIERIRSLTLKDKNNQPLKFLPGQLRSVTLSC